MDLKLKGKRAFVSGSTAGIGFAVTQITNDPASEGAPDLRRKQQWRQHTKASVFAEPFMWKFRANRKQWDIAIANHAGPGQLPRSLLSPFGSPTPCGLLQVRNMSPCSKKPNSVNGNTARNAVAIS